MVDRLSPKKVTATKIEKISEAGIAKDCIRLNWYLDNKYMYKKTAKAYITMPRITSGENIKRPRVASDRLLLKGL